MEDETSGSSETREELMHLRARMKADSAFSEAVRSGLGNVLSRLESPISEGTLSKIIFVTVDELRQAMNVDPDLPVPGLGPIAK